MALQQPNTSGSDISSGRTTERRTPQFIGGNSDPETGNVIPISRSEAARPRVAGVANSSTEGIARPRQVSPEATDGGPPAPASLAVPSVRPTASSGPSLTLPPPPSAPAATSTKLGAMTADEYDPGAKAPPSLTQTLGGAAASGAGAYLGSTIGANLGAQIGAGVGVGDALGSTASNAFGLIAGNTPVNPGVVGDTGPAIGSSLGSSVGSAAGAGVLSGVGTFAGGLISGQSPAEAAPGAVGSAVGATAGHLAGEFIGDAVLPGGGAFGAQVGQMIGSWGGQYLGNLFCHAAGTLIRMEDGSMKKIEDIRIGDRLWLGGAVISRGAMIVSEIYRYRGTLVTGGHAVFEDGRWLRVKDSPRAERISLEAPMWVYFLETEHHLLVCEDYICADQVEVVGVRGFDEKLTALNEDIERNITLGNIEFLHFMDGWEAQEFGAPGDAARVVNDARAAA